MHLDERIKAAEAWQRVYEYIITNRSGTAKEFVVTVSGTYVLNDVSNLRYFLTVAKRLYTEAVISETRKLVLYVNMQDLGADRTKEIRERLMRFLGIMLDIPYISVKLEQQKLNKEDILWSWSVIFPLCEATADGADGSMDYHTLKLCVYDQDLCQNGSQGGDLSKIGNIMLQKLQDMNLYKGISGKRISADKKENLRDTVNNYLHGYLGNMDILSEIVWLYFLIMMLESRQMIDLDGDPVIHEVVLNKMRMDAESYAEGMYQAIENACLHSGGKSAWFGFRIHRARWNAALSDIEKEVQRRNSLLEKYFNCFLSDKDAQYENIFSDRKKNYGFYFEFYVLDYALDGKGITPTFNDANGEIYANIADVVHRKCKEAGVCTPQQHVEDVVEHYGLRLLQKIVSVNDGYLMGLSPNGTAMQSYYSGREGYIRTENTEDVLDFTEWNVILPISFSWNNDSDLQEIPAGAEYYFGENILRAPRELVYIADSDVFKGVDDKAGDKQGQIWQIEGNLRKYITSNMQEERIFLIHPEPDISSLEIFAKGLFAVISLLASENKENICLRIALLMQNVTAAYEFIRLYSAYYFEGKQPDMKGVQVALCMGNTLYDGSYTVQFILNGEFLEDAYQNARLFAYHQPEDTAEHLPMLKYLTSVPRSNDPRKGTVSPVFPFDLFLPQELPDTSGAVELKRDPGTETWFIRRIRCMLKKDLREKEYGCCLDDIHIRLGSKVHMNRFYEAEMLFHDAGNVARFAWLIAQELICGNRTLLETGKNILLVGYEKYSAALILQVQRWLEAEGKFGRVFPMIVYDSNDEGEVASRRYFQEKDLSESRKTVTQVVTILPVGTTLSTVYKLLNTAKKDLASEMEFQPDEVREWNYCLILVNSDLEADSGDGTAVTKGYWKSIDRFRQIVSVYPEMKKSDRDRITEVNYLIPMSADWYDPETCPLCKKRGSEIRPLIRGRHSNTVPASIFGLLPDECPPREMNAPENNDKRMGELFHNVHYAHLYSSNNHFQFFIDHQDLYEQNTDSIHAWLSQCKINRNAFHVLFSPLQITNSGFLKAVVDYVFGGRVFLVHFEIKDAYREEIRSKFSHITENYKKVKRENPDASFCIHFADTSIVTGSSLNRFRLLANMLISQAGISGGRVAYFDKIFLLVNRCHFETINNFVRDPYQDFYSYINLRIPSYNTENDFCPACKLREKYALLGKRSSTQMLWEEFSRLAVKHTKREREEYLIWRREKLKGSASDFAVFMQYLQVCVPDENAVKSDVSKPFSYVPDVMDSYYNKKPTDYAGNLMSRARGIKRVIREYIAENFPDDDVKEAADLQSFFRHIGNIRLKDVNRFAARKYRDSSDSVYATFEKDSIDLMTDLSTSVRDYMRLVSMEQAYETLTDRKVRRDAKSLNPEEDIRWRRENMVKLIASQCRKASKLKSKMLDLRKLKNTGEGEEFALAYNVEWILSFIKVLSREQLTSYYNNRCAISGIMSDMYLLVSDTLSAKGRKKHIDELESEIPEWKTIIEILEGVCNRDGKPDSAVKITYQYQIYMTLLHRISDQQIAVNISGDEINNTVKFYYGLCGRYLRWRHSAAAAQTLYMVLPTAEKMILRYLRSLKLASMVSNDMVPGLRLADAPDNLIRKMRGEPQDIQETLLLFSRYIYLENTQVLYQGMRNLCKRVAEANPGMKPNWKLSEDFQTAFNSMYAAVKVHLEECYENLDGEGKQDDILKQNILSTFCIFWHRSMGCAPVSQKGNESLEQITGMLMYYRELDALSDEMQIRKQEDIPYYYEELCRCMCKVTGLAMCYIAYDEDGSNSEIFTQSGYQSDMFLRDRLLDSEKLKTILYRARTKWRFAFYSNEGRKGRFGSITAGGLVLTPNIAVLCGDSESDYLILRLQAARPDSYETGFYIIFQSEPEPERGFEDADDDKLARNMLQKARNILFMREKLQKSLTRDYAVLRDFRFDCSYVRKLRKKDVREGAAALHLSDIHIHTDVSKLIKEARKTIKGNLKKYEDCGIDLLVVSGDIIDSREANATAIEENYRRAEILLKNIAAELWEDSSGYLPHDWKKRVIITTGNHDYASVNQYHAVQRHRFLTAAMPSETESDTMAKFTYYIEFMVRFLDKPIDELLRNDLNDVWHYRRMNLKVIALNCSGKATALRTNKIGVNADKLEPLLRQTRWRGGATVIGEDEPFRICVAHYSPEYKLSYFMDSYSEAIPGWAWDPDESDKCAINKLVDKFCELMQTEVRNLMVSETILTGDDRGADLTEEKSGRLEEKPERLEVEADRLKKSPANELKRMREEYISLMAQLDLTLEVMESGQNINTVTADEAQKFYKAMMQYVDSSDPDLKKKAKNKVEEMRKRELYNLMKRYREWLEAGCDLSDEQMIKVMYQTARSVKMSERDTADFKKLVDHIVNEDGSEALDGKREIDLYLAGHVHSYAVSNPNGSVKSILVADRLYYEDISGINGFIITDMRVSSGEKQNFQYARLEEVVDL